MESNQREKKRARWFQQIAIGVVALLLIAGSVHFYRIHKAQSRLDQLLAVYRSRGEPTKVEDLQVPPVPDSENSAIDIQNAAKILNANIDESRMLSRIGHALPWTTKEKSAAISSLTTFDKALKYLTLATSRRGLDWRVQLKSPMIEVLLPNLGNVREISGLATVSAFEAHLRGEDGFALQHIREIIFLSRSVGKMPGGIVNSMVSFGLQGAACEAIFNIAAELKINDSDQTAATRKQVTALIAELLDEKRITEDFRRAMQGERVWIIDTIESILENKFRKGTPDPNWTPKLAWFKKADLLDDARTLAIFDTHVIESIDIGNDQAATSYLAPHSAAALESGMLAKFIVPSLSRAPVSYFRTITHCRIAATMLAIRLYTVDHLGKPPEKLIELVPAYLPAIPGDPMIANQPLKYIPRETDPILYSVGSNFIDDGGKTTPTDPKRSNADSPWSMLDAVFHYVRPPRDLSDLDEAMKDD